MKNVYNVPQNELIEETALELKKIESIKPPSWAEFVKTGANKERPPARDDWWYVRAASILRAIQKNGPVGVSKLRLKYGGKKNRGMKPERFYRASGNIIRKIFQQLEQAELVKKQEKGIHKGRIIAPKGASLLDKVAAKIFGKKPEKVEKQPEIKKDKEIKQTEVIDKKKDDKSTEKISKANDINDKSKQK
jgi:small subunit ribosomal protein S19e